MMKRTDIKLSLAAIILGATISSSGCRYVPDDFFRSLDKIQISGQPNQYEHTNKSGKETNHSY